MKFRVRIFEEILKDKELEMIAENIKTASKKVKELNLGKQYKIEALKK